MTDSDANISNWNTMIDEWNEQFLDAFEENVEAQATFVESWTKALDGADSGIDAGDGVNGFARAYEAWMDAATEMATRFNDVVEGEEVDPNEFRDIWLNSANEAFKEVMSTTAFAQLTGESIEDLLAVQREADETAQETLRSLGLPTKADVAEVGERLVELERRQHDVERTLESLHETLEDQ